MGSLHLNKSLNVLAGNSEVCYKVSNSQNVSFTQEIVHGKAVHIWICCECEIDRIALQLAKHLAVC